MRFGPSELARQIFGKKDSFSCEFYFYTFTYALRFIQRLFWFEMRALSLSLLKKPINKKKSRKKNAYINSRYMTIQNSAAGTQNSGSLTQTS